DVEPAGSARDRTHPSRHPPSWTSDSPCPLLRGANRRFAPPDRTGSVPRASAPRKTSAHASRGRRRAAASIAAEVETVVAVDRMIRFERDAHVALRRFPAISHDVAGRFEFGDEGAN